MSPFFVAYNSQPLRYFLLRSALASALSAMVPVSVSKVKGVPVRSAMLPRSTISVRGAALLKSDVPAGNIKLTRQHSHAIEHVLTAEVVLVVDIDMDLVARAELVCCALGIDNHVSILRAQSSRE